MTPGEQLQDLRNRLGLSRADIEQRTRRAISASAIAQWEDGRIKQPRRSAVERVDALMGADGAVLAMFGYATETNHATAVEVAELRGRVEDIERRLSALERPNVSPIRQGVEDDMPMAAKGRTAKPGKPRKLQADPEPGDQ